MKKSAMRNFWVFLLFLRKIFIPYYILHYQTSLIIDTITMPLAKNKTIKYCVRQCHLGFAQKQSASSSYLDQNKKQEVRNIKHEYTYVYQLPYYSLRLREQSYIRKNSVEIYIGWPISRYTAITI